MQHSTTNRSELSRRPRLATTIAFVGMVLMIMSIASMSFAQKSTQEIFASAEEASHALFLAVQNDDQRALMQILGGGKELVSSNDELEDKVERAQFAEKYQQMHRLVHEPDGATVLYVGAENWPFPVPLQFKGRAWYFDSDSGTQEILFRRVGENEATAVATCHAVARVKAQAAIATTSPQTIDDPVSQYAQTFVSNYETSAGKEESTAAFHGYYIRLLTEPLKKGAGAEGNNSSAGAMPVVVAYPAEYRSSGVMTFIVTEDGVVYEKDLGPDTTTLARKMTAGTLASSWRRAE
jgi:Protein of unknown function (DUF2950)